MPAPLKGNGIAHAPFSPLSVSLSLSPAANEGQYGYVGLGQFFAEVGKSRDAQGMQVTLNIFQKTTGGDKLAATVSLDQLAHVLGGPSGAPNPNPTFYGSLSDKKKFPEGLLPGSYRAEAIVYVLTDPISSGWLHSDRRWVEAGGAAVDFNIQQVNLLPVSEVQGELKTTATISPRRGATKVQIDQLNAEARSRVAKVYLAAKDIFVSQQAVATGAPARKSWDVYAYNSPNGLSATLGVSSGQSYQYLVPQLNSKISSVVKGGNTVVNLPGGLIVLKTSSHIQFQGWVNGVFAATPK